MQHTIVIYTDGSALGNPGRAGYAYLIIDKKKNTVSEYGGFREHATNNQMEMLALSGAFESLCHIEAEQDVVIHIDSEYVKNGITKWITNWKKNGWKTAAKKPVLNKEIWIEMEENYEKAKALHKIELKYVPGHAGIGGNEMVDTIARTIATDGDWTFFSGDKTEFEKLRNIKL